MNSRLFNKIIQLNKDFYDTVAAEFSSTRNSPWQGWDELLTFISSYPEINDLNILDIACGNGRFYRYINEKWTGDIRYTGIDTNDYLLNVGNLSEDNSGKITFKNLDVITEIDTIVGGFNLVVAFGISHHIPGFENRLKWFESVINLLDSDGIFCFTVWNYQKDTRSERFVSEIKTNNFEIKKIDLEQGDYFLGWNNIPNVYRYVHLYSEDEIEYIVKSLNLKVIHRFSSDGKSGNLNEYFLVKKS